MHTNEESGGRQSGSPENKDKEAAKPLSQTIPNAHATGDGAMGRSDEQAIEPDDEKRQNNDAEINKDPEQY